MYGLITRAESTKKQEKLFFLGLYMFLVEHVQEWFPDPREKVFFIWERITRLRENDEGRGMFEPGQGDTRYRHGGRLARKSSDSAIVCGRYARKTDWKYISIMMYYPMRRHGSDRRCTTARG